MPSPNITNSLIGLQNWVANQVKEDPILEKRIKLPVSKQSAPGPPPRQGLQWKPQTHRWIRPHDLTPHDFKIHFDNVASDLRSQFLMGDYDDDLVRLGYSHIFDSGDNTSDWLEFWHKSGLNALMERGIAKYMGREPSIGIEGGKFGKLSFPFSRDWMQDEEAVDFFESIARKHEDRK